MRLLFSNAQSPDLCALPNELLIQILTHLPTKILLHVAPVCHLFQILTARIIHTRLLQAVTSRDYSLQLRCHHPAADYTNEFYDYLGTPGLGAAAHARALPSNDDAAKSGLGGLYSRFGPAQRDEQKCNAGRVINMDEHELFSQLCTSLTLIKTVRYGRVYVQKKRTFRLFRDWLARCASHSNDSIRHGVCVEWNQVTSQECSLSSSELDHTIWTDQSQNVGLRVRVHDSKSSAEEQHGPLQDADKDQPVSYDLDIEELMIRSTFLLDSLERLSVSNKEWTRMAMVFEYLMAQNTN